MSNHALGNAVKVATNPGGFRAHMEQREARGDATSQMQRALGNGDLTLSQASAALAERVVNRQPAEEIAARVLVGQLTGE